VTRFVVDTSAVVGVALREPVASALVATFDGAELALMAAPAYVELGLVLEGRRPGDVGIGARLVESFGIEIQAFEAHHAQLAVDAWRRYGKGNHPAGLNFGDCCTFALAEHMGLPILSVGDDFRRTGCPLVEPT
jgi:ribonuclease VapC